MKDELCYLQKRFMSDGVTQRELKDINTEFSRLNLQLELCSLSHDVKNPELELEESYRQTMTVLREALSSNQRIEDEKLDEFMKDIENIRCVMFDYMCVYAKVDVYQIFLGYVS